MSRFHGVLPLFLVTAIGVFNGVWVFGPAFKEQQEKKQQAINAAAVPNPEKTKIQVSSKVDDVSVAADTRSDRGPPAPQSSWWNGLNLWTNDKSAASSDKALAETGSRNGSKHDPKA